MPKNAGLSRKSTGKRKVRALSETAKKQTIGLAPVPGLTFAPAIKTKFWFQGQQAKSSGKVGSHLASY
jgi:hypothetical protein